VKFVVDMNLSPEWCGVLAAEGWDTVHWSQVGSPSADDHTVLESAKSSGRILLTHDLDFGAILAATKTVAPSVVQIRVQDVLPETLGPRMVSILRSHETTLAAGALIVIEAARQRVRILPLFNDEPSND
jgi:predicted nuclease of predicted toxin-antitoxin system